MSAPPPPRHSIILYFLADCYEIWCRCKTSHDLKDSTVKISQGHHVGAHFHKMWQKLGNMIEKIWHTLKESHIWGSNSNIASVNDLNMLYFVSLMSKEDIPYLELTYLLLLMVQTLNETAIYFIKILSQHEKAPNTFYKWLNIPVKINVSCVEMMKTCAEVNLNLFQLCFILSNH